MQNAGLEVGVEWISPVVKFFFKSMVIGLMPSVVALGGTDFRMMGENLFSGSPAWAADRGSIETDSGTWRLAGPEQGTAAFSTPIRVAPGKEFFFSAEVRSSDRVVFFLAGLSMSYHRQGDWQTVAGLVRSNANEALDLRIQLRSLTGKAASAEVRNIVFQEVERPLAAVPAHHSGATDLIADSQAAATIVYPSSTEQGKMQALAIQAAVKELAGVELPILADTAATEIDFPILKPEFASQNLILIGRLGTNRAIWPAYNRFLAAVDGYYPGGDGFVLRTAANVFGQGKNHLIVGGSSETGVQRGVDAFLAVLKDQEVAEAGNLTVPWLLRVELGGESAEAFARDESLWQDLDDPLHYPLTPGYGRVTRWYQNAMGYYWTGRESYLERLKIYTAEVLADRAYTHHYIAEFFVRTLAMLDESPAFSREELAGLDNLVLENFLDFLTTADLGWMTVFSPPYSEIALRNRHQISPWFADFVMARYLKENIALSGALQELVEFRFSEKQAMMDSIVAERSGPTMPGIAAGSDFEEMPAAFFRYALESDSYEEFFASGLAHQALALDRLNHVSGRYAIPSCTVDLPMWLGALAHLTGHGGYRWLAENINYPQGVRGPFQGRYVAGVHRYQTGDDIAMADPEPTWSGVTVHPQPLLKDQTPEKTYSQFPLLNFRGGFGPQDDLLLINGVNPSGPDGVLGQLMIQGMDCFVGNSGDDGGANSRATTNGASAVRLSGYRPGSDAASSLASSRIGWLAKWSDTWAAGIETPISSDILWQRDVIRLARGVYLFADTFKAQRSGRYLLRVNWNPTFPARPVEGGWEMLSKHGRVQIQFAGENFEAVEQKGSLSWLATRALDADQTDTVWTLVQRLDAAAPAWHLEKAVGPRLRLMEPAAGQSIWIKGDAGDDHFDLAAVRGERIQLFGLREEPTVDTLLPSLEWSDRQSNITPEGAEIASPEALLTKVRELAELSWEVPASTVAEDAAEDDSSNLLTFVEAEDQWQTAWQFDGFLRPARIQPIQISDGLVEFERPFEIAEVRASPSPGPWVAGLLPDKIEATASSTESEAKGWFEIAGTRINRPGTRTGNYGETSPEPETDAALLASPGQKIQQVRAPDAGSLQFFTSDNLEARHPIKLELISPRGQAPFIFARTEVFPAFPRALRDDDMSFALLAPDTGKILGEAEVSGPVQQFAVAEQRPGQTEIFAVKADARVEVFDLNGKRQDVIDHHAQSVNFDATHGTGATRAPYGGHFMPFSIAFWRGAGDHPAKIVLGRYGSAAFLDGDRNLEGVLTLPSYAFAAALPRGYDFNGDGQEELLLLERFRLSHISGDSTSRILPSGKQPWPQVYDLVATSSPKDSDTPRLAGEPVHLFTLIESWGERPRWVALVRSNYVAVYDALERKWIFSWRPPAPISSAALVRETDQQITLLLSTVDGLLWTCTLDQRRVDRPAVQVVPVPFEINHIASSPAKSGEALLSTSDGLFLRQPDGVLQRAAPGVWQSGLYLSKAGPNSVRFVAVDEIGNVIAFRERQ